MFKKKNTDYYQRFLDEQKKTERDKYKFPKEVKFYSEVNVAALDSNMGVTHIAAGIANFLSGYGNTVLKSQQLLADEMERKRLVEPSVKVIDITDSSLEVDYFVDDIGVINCKSFEVKPLTANILICDASAKHLRKLAEFVADNSRSLDIIYLFNIVSETDISHINYIMKTYPHHFINGELFSPLGIPDKVRHVLGQAISRN